MQITFVSTSSAQPAAASRLITIREIVFFCVGTVRARIFVSIVVRCCWCCCRHCGNARQCDANTKNAFSIFWATQLSHLRPAQSYQKKKKTNTISVRCITPLSWGICVFHCSICEFRSTKHVCILSRNRLQVQGFLVVCVSQYIISSTVH